MLFFLKSDQNVFTVKVNVSVWSRRESIQGMSSGECGSCWPRNHGEELLGGPDASGARGTGGRLAARSLAF